MQYIREYWSKSKTYRILLILAVLYAVLRLALQVSLFTDVLDPTVTTDVSADLQQSYIASAQRFQAYEDLYRKDWAGVTEYYFYSPAFAFFSIPILLLPLPSLLPLTVIFHVAVYMLLYIWWSQIFEENNLFHIGRQWARLLPLYLVFSVFWDDLAYTNIYTILALLATFSINAILHERLAAASFWLGAAILPVDPRWAFALALPLLLGRYRFLLKLLAGTALAYLTVAFVTVIAGGFDYGLQQYQDYFSALAHLVRDYPWRGPDQPFLGYNHSILQTVFYFLGISDGNVRLATILKLMFLLPLAWVGWKFLRQPGRQAGSESPGTALALVFVLYLASLLCLDMLWELSLSIVIFTYLLATSKEKQTHALLWAVFGPYAFLDIWRVASYLRLGNDILYQGSYVLTDPFIYVPWMIVIVLVFYAILLFKLDKLSLKLP